MKRSIKKVILRTLVFLRLYPNVIFTSHTGKYYEFKELLKDVKFTGKESVLDLGCGTGLQTLLIGAKCKRVVGVDTSESSILNAQFMAEFVKGRINSEFLCGTIEEAGFEDESFDKIFSFCVIEHIPNYVEVLHCLHRLLRKGGELIFTADSTDVLEDKELVERHRKECFVEHYFNQDELDALLEEVGFCDINIYPIFKSKYAEKLWKTIFNANFNYGPLRSFFSYMALKWHESRCSAERTEGLFLVAKCRKKEA